MPLLPGVLAPRRHPQADPRPPQELPRLLRQRLGDQDHAGQLPLVLFVFETHEAEAAFLLAAGAHRLPICTSNLEMINDLGVLREVWRWPPPNAPDRLPLHRMG